MKKIKMEQFVKKIEKGIYDTELLVDGNIFSEKTILKAAYELVDKVYMFFKKNGDDYIVQFKLKNKDENLEEIVDSFGEELVYHRLREAMDKKYGKLREKIIETALGFGLSLEDVKGDLEDVISKIKEMQSASGNDNVDDSLGDDMKSIDEIISEIETDPDFADDKDEIISILKEIEEETE